MRSPLRFGVVALAGIVACLVPAGHALAQPAAVLASRLVSCIAAGDADSARALIRANRGVTPEALEVFFAQRAGSLLDQRSDSAAAFLELARSIAAIYLEVHADSFCLRMVRFQDELPAERVAADAAGWKGILETRQIYNATRWPEAWARFPELTRLVQEARDPFLEERVYRLAGNCLHSMSRYEDAYQRYEKALEIARRLDDRVGESRTLCNIAAALQAFGRVDEAIDMLRRALQSAQRLGDRELAVVIHNNIGNNFAVRGTPDSARVWYERGLALAREQGNRALEAAFLTNLGVVLAKTGEYEAAIDRQKEVLRICREPGAHLKTQELSALIFLGEDYANVERYSEALVVLAEAIEIAEAVQATSEVGMLHSEMGEMCSLLGRPKDAIEHYREALAAQRRSGAALLHQDLLHNLGLA